MRFYRNICLLAAVFSFLIAPSFAYAKEADRVTEQTAAVSEPENELLIKEAQGLPQFDFSYFPEQAFWLVVSFSILYLLLHFIAVPRIAKTQDNRRTVITTNFETARKANEEAKAASVKADTQLREAREKSKNKVTNMISTLEEEESNKKHSKEKEVLKKIRIAENKIEVAKTKALSTVSATAEEISEEIVQKILKSIVKA
ncbi:MAG: hypothetical protein FWF23_03110 [Alphaproteobacteria bacterium]|nr:hypothetical protein [Alphaproteobacteria bacterium]MCL2505579.1 hypothetical protein [Alphaproteobacteria bacterium]